MKQSVNFYDFERAFQNMDRFDQFGYDALKALFDYLEQLEDDLGEEIELDVIALCCDFTYYESLEEFQRDYSSDYETIEDVEQETTVIQVESLNTNTMEYEEAGFIIQAF